METSTDLRRRKPSGTGAVILAAGGVIAGLATASCCALPILLGSLGLGSAWLFRLTVAAAPRRTALLVSEPWPSRRPRSCCGVSRPRCVSPAPSARSLLCG
jgi:hypothetical protein